MKNLNFANALLSILVVVVLSACGSPGTEINPAAVVVSGQIVNRDSLSPQTVTANFQNPFDYGSSPAVSLRPDGSFRFEYEMPYGQTINILYGNRYIVFYAGPGDEVQLTVDASQLHNDDISHVVDFGGDKAELNSRFGPAHLYFGDMRREPFDEVLTPEQFVDAVGERIAAGRDSLAAYAGREGLTGREAELIENNLVVRILDAASEWRWGEPHTEAMRRLCREVVDILDSRYASSDNYTSTLLNLYFARYQMDPGFMDDPVAAMPGEIRKMAGLSAGLARDILVYQLFYGLSQMAPDAVGTFAPDAQTLFDSEYARERFSVLVDGEKVPEFAPMPLKGISLITPGFGLEPLTEVDMFRYLAEKHSGKVVYIDIMAHWCGFCIEQIPHSKKLKEALEGEDVVFVVLWLESDFDAAVDLMRRQEWQEEGYFFSTDAARLFYGTYRLPGFPTYMLMDRSGKLVDNNARPPSDPGTENRIRELLR